MSVSAKVDVNLNGKSGRYLDDGGCAKWFRGRPMTDPTADNSASESGRRPNLRVTFWGVQGSCPIFPTQDEVHEFAERIASYTVQRTLRDIAERMERGECSVEKLRAM